MIKKENRYMTIMMMYTFIYILFPDQYNFIIPHRLLYYFVMQSYPYVLRGNRRKLFQLVRG